MYAIVATGGKQYKVAKGDIISVEKLDAQPGDEVELNVLMLNDGKTTVVDKGEKVLVFKLKKRKRYHRTNGHRQNLTKLRISALPTEDEAE